MYYNARFFDPALGTFVSPDTTVPQAGVVADYNRFAYVRSNPLKYTDPTGYYSDDEIMQHFGCSDWACVEAFFGDGGQYAGLWGWLYMLQMAEDGYLIESLAYGKEYGQGWLTGRFQRNADGIIEILAGEMSYNGSLISVFGGPASGQMFAGYADAHDGGFYLMREVGKGSSPRHRDLDCTQVDCVAIAIDGVAVLGSGLALGSPMCGLAAPECAATGLAIGEIATLSGFGWTVIQGFQGNVSGGDAVTTGVLTGVSYFSEIPVVGLAADLIQLAYDLKGD